MVKKSTKRASKTTDTGQGKTLPLLPIRWQLATGSETVGLWADEHVWTGNSRGEVLCLARATGEVLKALKLPGECVAVVSDEHWKYAGCADGNVYDLTGSVPRVAFQLGSGQVYWLEVFQGSLAASNRDGTVTLIGVDGAIQWQVKDSKAVDGWVLRVDSDGLFHGSHAGMRRYDWAGKRQWSANPGDVRYGCLDGEHVLVTAGCMVRYGKTELALLSRETGQLMWSTVPKTPHGEAVSTGAEACGVELRADGTRRYYIGTQDWLFCFDVTGQMLWRAPTGCAQICNLQVVDEELFFATSSGQIVCMSLRDEDLARCERGEWETPVAMKQKRVKAKSTKVERTRDASGGVVLECVKQGSRLRMRVISEGYRDDWFCQFPSDLREEGARYVVDQVRVATQGGFYRALGDIRRLDS
ncbi:MAG: PQQ-binding-like beta-propeller repeat protein [Deltaproteobacteria bacterium]|nr:PQQ-binding-like beta-propeller repeat protein [Deltaproteobacteria bacterium]